LRSRVRKTWELLVKGIRKPQETLPYIRCRYIEKRVPFTFENVVCDWGAEGAGLPQFSARLYAEVLLLNKAIANYHAERSLEIGCGYGRLTPWIADHSSEHHAIEPESVLLAQAMKLHPSIRFHKVRAQELPFPNGYFDLCVSWTVLQHVYPKQLSKAVSEIKRVCGPRAIIILAEGVGQKESDKGYWERSLEEWRSLFLPWKLNWFSERKIEATFPSSAGLVMRFERTEVNPKKQA